MSVIPEPLNSRRSESLMLTAISLGTALPLVGSVLSGVLRCGKHELHRLETSRPIGVTSCQTQLTAYRPMHCTRKSSPYSHGPRVSISREAEQSSPQPSRVSCPVTRFSVRRCRSPVTMNVNSSGDGSSHYASRIHRLWVRPWFGCPLHTDINQGQKP